MKIIDFRFRPHTEAILNGIKNSTMFKASCEASGFDKWQPQTLDEIVADLKARGVTRCVITGRDCQTTYGFPDNNGSVLEFCRAYPDMFLGFWGIDPHKGMDAVREVEKVVKEYGMKGIATDPYLAHLSPCEARYYPIYAKCCELNVPVFITMAPPMVPGIPAANSIPVSACDAASDAVRDRSAPAPAVIRTPSAEISSIPSLVRMTTPRMPPSPTRRLLPFPTM